MDPDLLILALLNPVSVGLLAWGTSAVVQGWVSSKLSHRWRDVAALMPGLPPRSQREGEPGARFDAAVLDVLPGVMALAEQADGPVEAVDAASKLGQPVEVVAAAIEAVADRADHHLQVTRSGRLLYHFDRSSLDAARTLLKPPVYGKIAGWAALLLANFGTAWPLLTTLGVAGYAVWLGWRSNLYLWLGIGLLAIAALAAVTHGLSLLVGFVTRPPDQPQLVDPIGEDEDPDELQILRQTRQFLAEIVGGRKDASVQASDWFELAWGAIRHVRDVRAAFVVVVTVLFGATVVGAAGALYAFAAGLWRVLDERKTTLTSTAPGRWVRVGESPGGLTTIAPSGDIAGRAFRATWLALTGTRPGDDALNRRVHRYAAARHGSISALDLALTEGMDLEEAISIGTRVTVLAGGTVEVSDEGDVMFFFAAQHDDDFRHWPPSEVVSLQEDHQPLAEEAVAVNVVGLTRLHLAALDRLTGGALMMAVSAPGVAWVIEQVWGVSGSWLLPGAVAMLVAALSTVALAAATRATVTASARLGALRDTRRIALDQLKRAGQRGKGTISAEKVARRIHRGLKRIWPELPAAIVVDEIVRAFEQVGVPMDVEASGRNGGEPTFELAPLKVRFLALAAIPRPVQGDRADDDEVVFDTRDQQT